MYNKKLKADVKKYIEKCPEAGIRKVFKPYELYLPLSLYTVKCPESYLSQKGKSYIGTWLSVGGIF